MTKRGQSVHFLDKSKLKTHCARRAPSGGAGPGTLPPGWLCTLRAGPGPAAGRAQPAPRQPRPSAPPPSSAPAPAAAALVCSRLRTTCRDRVGLKPCYTWTFGHQVVRFLGAYTVLWVGLELFRWAQGFFSALLWVCLSPHKPNAVPFEASWCCHKQRRQTDGEAAAKYRKERKPLRIQPIAECILEWQTVFLLCVVLSNII